MIFLFLEIQSLKSQVQTKLIIKTEKKILLMVFKRGHRDSTFQMQIFFIITITLRPI